MCIVAFIKKSAYTDGKANCRQTKMLIAFRFFRNEWKLCQKKCRVTALDNNKLRKIFRSVNEIQKKKKFYEKKNCEHLPCVFSAEWKIHSQKFLPKHQLYINSYCGCASYRRSRFDGILRACQPRVFTPTVYTLFGMKIKRCILVVKKNQIKRTNGWV